MKKFFFKEARSAALLVVLIPVMALAQDQPVTVPDYIPDPPRGELQNRRAALIEKRDALKARVAAHNQSCSSIPEGSSLESECRQKLLSLQSEIGSYSDDVRRFNSAVTQVINSLSSQAGEKAQNVRRRVSELKMAEARRKCIEIIQDPEELRSKAALEKARGIAIENLKKDIQLKKKMQATIEQAAAEFRKDPGMRQIDDKFNDFIKSVEEETDGLMKQGLVLPEDSDLDFLFGPRNPGRVWPGPKNPDVPLPNPLDDDKKRQKIREMVIFNRREAERLNAIFERVDFVGLMLEDMKVLEKENLAPTP